MSVTHFVFHSCTLHKLYSLLSLFSACLLKSMKLKDYLIPSTPTFTISPFKPPWVSWLLGFLVSNFRHLLSYCYHFHFNAFSFLCLQRGFRRTIVPRRWCFGLRVVALRIISSTSSIHTGTWSESNGSRKSLVLLISFSIDFESLLSWWARCRNFIIISSLRRKGC